MNKLLPNQVYAGLFEIVKNQKFYYNSRVGIDYSHLTDEGKEQVVEWINAMAPYMIKLEEEQFKKRAGEIVWEELKK